MKNKKIIIIVVVLAIIALAVYFWLKAKKKTSVVGSTAKTIDQSIAASVNAVKQTQVPIKNVAPPESPATQSQPFNSSQTPAPAPTLGTEYNFVDVIRDGSQGKAIIQFQPVNRDFSVNESVKILSGPYAGTHKIWYIYRGTQSGAPVHNLYLETPFTSKVSGKFYKA